MTCAILNADYKLGVPGTDRDLVNNLIQNKILPTEMKEILGSMKGFRNMVQTQ
nr:HepT-like ribonuclease domain-containing protein [Methanohalobium sp.]